MPSRPAETLRDTAPAGQWPLVVAVAGAVAGLLVGLLVAWRLGALLVGAAVGVAALERLVLSDRLAGLLRVRSRGFDVTALTTMAVGIVVCALVIAEAPA